MGATAVAAYSTRARPGAAVSTPIAWDELGPQIRANHFTVENLPNRLAYLDRDPWEGFFKLSQTLPERDDGKDARTPKKGSAGGAVSKRK
jgi:bifunctional non-homologous end joining protein LigD